MTVNKTYKQRKKEKTAKKITARAACNCYLKEQGREDEEKQYHDPVWNIGLYKNA
jgi:hypothetical protein